MRINKAVILAAGMGKRFYPYSQFVAKEMLPVVDIPAFSLLLDEVVDAGISDVCVVTATRKTSLNEYLDSDHAKRGGLNIHKVYQTEANGTGAALLLTEAFVGGEACAILNGDDLIYNEASGVTGQLCAYYDKVNGTVVGVQEVERERISLYGSVKIVNRDGRGMLIEGIVEKPSPESAPSCMSSLGRYIISPDMFDYLKALRPSKNGEYVFTDAIDAMARQKPVYAYDFEGRRYDLGKKSGYLQAVVEYALRHEATKDDFASYLKGLKLD